MQKNQSGVWVPGAPSIWLLPQPVCRSHSSRRIPFLEDCWHGGLVILGLISHCDLWMSPSPGPGAYGIHTWRGVYHGAVFPHKAPSCTLPVWHTQHQHALRHISQWTIYWVTPTLPPDISRSRGLAPGTGKPGHCDKAIPEISVEVTECLSEGGTPCQEGAPTKPRLDWHPLVLIMWIRMNLSQCSTCNLSPPPCQPLVWGPCVGAPRRERGCQTNGTWNSPHTSSSVVWAPVEVFRKCKKCRSNLGVGDSVHARDSRLLYNIKFSSVLDCPHVTFYLTLILHIQEVIR